MAELPRGWNFVNRPGLTRIDILIGTLILVLVGGLLLSVVQRMREAADLMKCRNNLKQIGLATHNYVASNGRLPPLVMKEGEDPTNHSPMSVIAQLMPYLEANPYYYRARLSRDGYDAHTSTVARYEGKGGTPIVQEGGMANDAWPLFLDPADFTANKLRDVPMTLPDGTTGYYATGSYAANGVLPWGVRCFSLAFTRGLPNTIMFAERPQVCRTAAGDDVYNLWGVGFYSPHMPAFAALTPDDPPGLWSTGQIAPVLPLPDEQSSDRDSLIRVRVGRANAAPSLPDFPTPIQRSRSGRPCDPRLPATPHRAGMLVLMADGHVQTFAFNTSPWVFWSACDPTEPSADR